MKWIQWVVNSVVNSYLPLVYVVEHVEDEDGRRLTSTQGTGVKEIFLVSTALARLM